MVTNQNDNSVIGYYFEKRAVIIVPSLWVGTIIMISINFSGDLTH